MRRASLDLLSDQEKRELDYDIAQRFTQEFPVSIRQPRRLLNQRKLLRSPYTLGAYVAMEQRARQRVTDGSVGYLYEPRKAEGVQDLAYSLATRLAEQIVGGDVAIKMVPDPSPDTNSEQSARVHCSVWAYQYTEDLWQFSATPRPVAPAIHPFEGPEA